MRRDESNFHLYDNSGRLLFVNLNANRTFACNHIRLKTRTNYLPLVRGLPLCAESYLKMKRTRLKAQDKLVASGKGLLSCAAVPLLPFPLRFDHQGKIEAQIKGLLSDRPIVPLLQHFWPKHQTKLHAWLILYIFFVFLVCYEPLSYNV